MAFIYKVTNNINGKIYIGKSKYNNPQYYGSGTKVTASIKKYGKASFSKVILEECNDTVVSSREIYWIEYYQSTNNAIGYNISKGGEGGSHYWATLTDAQRLEHNNKISKARTGQRQAKRGTVTRNKQSASFKEHADKNPEFFKKRALAKCKWYLCINHAENKLFRTKNLKEFCQEHNLNFASMRHNARTQKNYCNKIWTCSMELYLGQEPASIIKQVVDSITANNLAYRDKIRQVRLQRKIDDNMYNNS